MDVLNSFDLFLYCAMIVDLLIKNYRVSKVKRKMGKWHRYQKNNTQLKKGFYIVIIAVNILYVAYRLYNIVINHNLNFHEAFLILPVICYYVLFDMFINGIYYSSRSIYYKQEHIYYRDIIRSIRVKEGQNYIYAINYRNKQSGARDIEIKIKDEVNAYAILSSIPFKEMNE